MHQGLSYQVLERISRKLNHLQNSNQTAYHVCWEHSSALCGAIEQDLQYMGGSQGWPCIVELSFSLKDITGEGKDSFRAIVKYPGRFQDDIRVVVTGLIHIGRIDVKVRNIAAIASEVLGNTLTTSCSEESEDIPQLLADQRGQFWIHDKKSK